MNKHSNHVEYICTKARKAMGFYALRYFGKYNSIEPVKYRIEQLICDWYRWGQFSRDSRKVAAAEKCRNVAIRLIERNGGLSRTLAALKKNDACKAWTEFNKAR